MDPDVIHGNTNPELQGLQLSRGSGESQRENERGERGVFVSQEEPCVFQVVSQYPPPPPSSCSLLNITHSQFQVNLQT